LVWYEIEELYGDCIARQPWRTGRRDIVANTFSPTDFSDRDRRWLVHIFAALCNGIQDELECDGIPSMTRISMRTWNV
jgi:hypothetical protein